MGKLVTHLAERSGAEVGAALSSGDSSRPVPDLIEELQGHDVAIDFSVGSAVLRNIEVCARAAVPLVEGTTGWLADEPQARQLVSEHNGALVYGANFSIGVNLFYRLVAQASALFAAVEGYEAFIEEAHHSRKRDAPSGTALRLRSIMSERWPADISISSTRAGQIPGTHRVGFDSAADQVRFTHEARSREGFAGGALLAARWIAGRKGVFEFSEVLDEILKSGKL